MKKVHEKQTSINTKLLLIVSLNLDSSIASWDDMLMLSKNLATWNLHEIYSLKDGFKLFDDLGTTLIIIYIVLVDVLPPKYQGGSSEMINPADVGKINAQAISNLGEDSR